MTEADIVNSLIGIPYKRLGRDESGLDCWGLVMLCTERLGLRRPPDPMIACDNRLAVSNAISNGIALEGFECERKDYCIVFSGGGRRSFHGGFSIFGGILHAKKVGGVQFSDWRHPDFVRSRCYDWSAR